MNNIQFGHNNRFSNKRRLKYNIKTIERYVNYITNINENPIFIDIAVI